MIKSIIGHFDINDTQINNQNQFIDSYLSVVTLTNVVVTEVAMSDLLIRLSTSTITIDHLIFINISNPDNLIHPLIGISDAIIHASDITYNNNNASFVILLNVAGTISNLNIDS